MTTEPVADMERKPKDINQLYKEMEEIVAQQVRETMELADIKRRALAQGVQLVTKTERVEDETDTVIEHVTNKLNEAKEAAQMKRTEDEIPQEFEDTNILTRSPTLETSENVPEFQFGFEQFTATDGQLKNTDHTETQPFNSAPSVDEKNSQIGFECFEPEESRYELAQGALSLAQNVIDPEVAQRNNNNNPFEVPEGENEQLRRMGEDALFIAENAVRNPFELSDEDEELEFRLGNPFDAHRLGQDALSLAQNASVYKTNPFDSSDDEDIRQLGVDALSIAQTAARDIEAEKQIGANENVEDLDNAFNSLIDPPKSVVEIGFDHLKHVFEKQKTEEDPSNK